MVIWVLIAILIAVNILLLVQKVSNAIVGLIGAASVIAVGYFSGLFDFAEALGFIDFNAIFLLVGLFIIIQVTKESGLFQFITLKIVSKTGGRAYLLYISFMALTFFLAGLIGSITAILIIGSMTAITSDVCDYDPVPFLIVESFIADMGGTTLISGSVSVIVASNLLQISYLQWAAIAYPLGLVFLGLSILIAPKLQRRRISAQKMSSEVSYELELLDPWSVVPSKRMFYTSAIVLVFTFIMFFLSSLIGVGLGYIAILSATIMLLASKTDPQGILQKTDWETIFYIIGLSITIGGVTAGGVLTTLGDMLSIFIAGNILLALLLILWVTSFLTGALDNLAVTLTFIPIIRILSTTIPLLPMAYALIIGADIGITFLPWATTNGLIAMSIAKGSGLKIKVREYAKVGLLNICYLSVSSIFFAILSIL